VAEVTRTPVASQDKQLHFLIDKIRLKRYTSHTDFISMANAMDHM